MTNICLYLCSPENYFHNHLAPTSSPNGQGLQQIKTSSCWAKVALIMAVAALVLGGLLAAAIVVLPAIVATLGGMALLCALMALRGYNQAKPNLPNTSDSTTSEPLHPSSPLPISPNVQPSLPITETIEPIELQPIAPPSYPLTSAAAEKIVEEFWKEHIQPFKMTHGTTSLYYSHFKKYGVSHHYPPQLAEIIDQIRTLWAAHQDIIEKTQYFTWFENRYDEAIQQNKVCISFSMSPSIIGEFTVGERAGGGEWIREVRRFVLYSEQKLSSFSFEEKKILLKIKALIHLMAALPPMTVKTFYRGSGMYANLCFAWFSGHVQMHCNWKNSAALSSYLNEIQASIQSKKKLLQSCYEIPVTQAIPPEELEIEIMETIQSEKPSTDPIQIPFDEPQTLNHAQLAPLKITMDGFSDLSVYQGSRFIVAYLDDKNCFRVTRKLITSEDAESLELNQYAKACMQEWIKAFECDELIQKYHISIT